VGLHACRNGLQIRQDALDAAVVDVLVKALEPDVLAEAVRSAVTELQADHAALIARRSIVIGELATIANRERRLLDALADGDADASATAIRARLREEFSRRDALTTELERLDATPMLDADAVVADVQARAADLRGLLARHVTQARQVVRLLLEGRLVCQPFEDENERGYSFTATGTYRRLGVPVVESVNVGGGPNGIRTRVSALRGPRPRSCSQALTAPRRQPAAPLPVESDSYRIHRRKLTFEPGITPDQLAQANGNNAPSGLPLARSVLPEILVDQRCLQKNGL